jgi:hypothetical protein
MPSMMRGVERGPRVNEPPCVGDCNEDGGVTIDEVLLMVNIALETLQMDDCVAGDGNLDGQITVDEIVTAVEHALCGCNGCPAAPPTRTFTPTATPSRTGTATPTATPAPPTPAEILFRESWESSRVGIYRPAPDDQVTVFGADSGSWFVSDTVSAFPEDCGVSQNFAEIFAQSGQKQLRLTSVPSDSDCADNVFVGSVQLNPPNPRPLNIPLGTDVYLSFRSTAALQQDQRCNAALLQVSLDTFRTITYVLQRTPDWDVDPDRCTDITFDAYLLLDPTREVQVRNIWQDADTVEIRRPGHIVAIGMEVTDGGSAVFDEITVFRGR